MRFEQTRNQLAYLPNANIYRFIYIYTEIDVGGFYSDWVSQCSTLAPQRCPLYIAVIIQLFSFSLNNIIIVDRREKKGLWSQNFRWAYVVRGSIHLKMPVSVGVYRSFNFNCVTNIYTMNRTNGITFELNERTTIGRVRPEWTNIDHDTRYWIQARISIKTSNSSTKTIERTIMEKIEFASIQISWFWQRQLHIANTDKKSNQK